MDYLVVFVYLAGNGGRKKEFITILEFTKTIYKFGMRGEQNFKVCFRNELF